MEHSCIHTHFKLKAVDFDHPEGPKDLSKVGGFIAVPRREAEIITQAPVTLCQAPSLPHGFPTATGGMLCCPWLPTNAPLALVLPPLGTPWLCWPWGWGSHVVLVGLAVPRQATRTMQRARRHT